MGSRDPLLWVTLAILQVSPSPLHRQHMPPSWTLTYPTALEEVAAGVTGQKLYSSSLVGLPNLPVADSHRLLATHHTSCILQPLPHPPLHQGIQCAPPTLQSHATYRPTLPATVSLSLNPSMLCTMQLCPHGQGKAAGGTRGNPGTPVTAPGKQLREQHPHWEFGGRKQFNTKGYPLDSPGLGHEPVGWNNTQM